MSQTLKINNWGSTNLIETTRLDADIATPTTSITAQNNEGFAAGDYFLIGTPGSETAEVLVVESTTGATGITATNDTTLEHTRYDYINKLFGSHIKIYRASNTSGLQPADSEFSVIDTVAIDHDQAYTLYTDSAGDNTYWYKFTYYNSTTSIETNLSDSKSSRGGGTGDYCSIDAIRTQAGFKYAKYITDDMIDEKRQAAQDEINGTLHGFYPVPFAPPINPFISDICVRLAAGLLLVEQYGQTRNTTTTNGQAQIDAARADLQALALKEKVLVDTNGSSLAEAGSTGAIEGWPNASTNTTPGSSGGAPRVFRMSDIQGQPMTSNDGHPTGNLYYGRKW